MGHTLPKHVTGTHVTERAMRLVFADNPVRTAEELRSTIGARGIEVHRRTVRTVLMRMVKQRLVSVEAINARLHVYTWTGVEAP